MNKLFRFFFYIKNQQTCLDFVGENIQIALREYYYYVFEVFILNLFAAWKETHLT